MQTKRCGRCKAVKVLDDFHFDKGTPTGRRNACKECMAKIRKVQYARHRKARVASTLRWRNKNREFFKASQRRLRQEIRQKFIDGYGGKCTCCGEATPEFLTLEHPNRDGKEHGQRKGCKGSTGKYRDVIKRGFPKEYTILCCNCNYAERYGKQCPHKLARLAERRTQTRNDNQQ